MRAFRFRRLRMSLILGATVLGYVVFPEFQLRVAENLLASSVEKTSHDDGEEAATATATALGGSIAAGSIADYEVTTTNYGWNTPSGHDHVRYITSGEFFNATLAHPRYNSSSWSDLEAHPDPSRRIIAFLDVETCFDGNYPVYGASTSDPRVNMERGHRIWPHERGTGHQCQHIKRAAESPAITSNPDSRLIVLDCGVMNKLNYRKLCHDPTTFASDHVMVAYLSSPKTWMRPRFDVGIPPPAIRPAELNASEREAVHSCKGRTFLFSFQGRGDFGRENLLQFRDEPDFYVNISPRKWGPVIPREGFGDDFNGGGDVAALRNLSRFEGNDYRGIMAESAFAGAPKGDVLFSYRFSEALSAGAVPVVYADDWLPPFSDAVVNWTECAVFVPESQYGMTAQILRAIPEGRRCEMQRCALDVWDRYASSRAGWVRGLLEAAVATWGLNSTEMSL